MGALLHPSMAKWLEVFKPRDIHVLMWPSLIFTLKGVIWRVWP
jgi:hypothetical protein